MQFQRFIVLILSAIVLIACGGGSNSSSAPVTGSEAPVRTRTITISQSSVSFEAEQFTNLPPSQTIGVEFDAPLLTLGTLPGERLPDWLGASVSQTSNTRGTFTFSIRDTNLDPGTYETTLRAVSSNDSGSQVFDTVDIPIRYTVTPITPITLDVGEISFKAAPIQDPVVRTVTLMGDGINWEVNSFNAGITLNPRSGTISTDGQVVEIIFSPDEVSPPTDQSLEISFRNADAPLSSTTLNVSIEFVDGVFTEPNSLTFETIEGDTRRQSETIKIDNFDITTEAQINWNASSDQAWLTATPDSGVIDTNAASESVAEMVLTVDPTGLDVGTYEAMLKFENDVSEQIYNMPVSFVIAERKVVTSQVGVAFSNQSNLEKLISVEDSQGTLIDWTASTTASWLNVSESGAAGEPLIIKADPSGLSNNSLSEAIVKVTSPLSEISNEVSIYVGLWNSSEATDENVINIDSDQVGPFLAMATDPVRPYVYVVKSEASASNKSARTDLYVYNSHTGEEITPPISSQVFLSPVVIPSDDGRFLYVIPSSSDGRDGGFERYDLPTLGSPTRFDLPASVMGGSIDFTRVNGVPYLITGKGGVIDAETGTVLSSLPQVRGGSLAASQNGRICLRSFSNNDSAKLACFALFGTGNSDDNIAAISLTQNQASFDTNGFEISLDGNIVYIILNDQLSAFSTEDITKELFSIDGAFQVIRSRIGTILTSTFTEDNTALQIRAFSEDGDFLGSAPASLDPTFFEFTVSSDGKRVALFETDISNGEDIVLRLIDAP